MPNNQLRICFVSWPNAEIHFFKLKIEFLAKQKKLQRDSFLSLNAELGGISMNMNKKRIKLLLIFHLFYVNKF